MQFAICNGLLLTLLLASPHEAWAHPVGLRVYERTIDVRLTAEGVTVGYRLELTQETAVKDLIDIDNEALNRLTRPREFHEAFTRVYAPIFAANLIAKLDGKELELACVHRGHEVLDHLRCDFVFQARWDLRPGRRHEFSFHEGNYVHETGLVRLSLGNDPSAPIIQKTEPDEALKTRSYTELRSGDEKRMRDASATFEVVVLVPRGQPARESVEASAVLKPDPSASAAEPRGWLKPEGTPAPAEAKPGPAPEAAPVRKWGGEDSLLRLFLNSEHGFWMMLLVAAGLGAAHALTPGHGKTLVAAYLVGQRGTVWHALLLGLVTTLTHTGIVLVLAVVLRVFFPGDLSAEAQRGVDTALGLAGGVLIAGLGTWLLFRRLAGQADHFHAGGHGPHHHHHHEHAQGQADHYHDGHGHAHPLPADGGVWGLIVLGVQGGIVPCWDAVVLLLAAVAMNQLGLALPLLLAFSAGLAGVLIAIGILVVHARGLAGARWGESRLFKALPLLSAVLITGLGLWLCYDRLHGRSASPDPAVHSRP